MRTKHTVRKSTSGTAPRRLLSRKPMRASFLNGDDDDANSDDANNDEINNDANDEDNEDARDIYDARLLRVTAALAEVERPGDCFAHRALAQFPLPGLVVDGLGEVALPLRERDARELIARCHLAPYGHGEQTLVDTAVRNTWELSAAQFALRNAQWQRAVDAMAESVRAPLGISEGTEFDAKLYKLLLYEEGGMFHAHQDSEKEVGMFGTLVVVLPGHFKGGELVVHHPAMAAAQRAPHVWDPASMNPYDVKYAAFYGDCEHEVKPVTSGFRLCLTYNLVTRSTTRVPRFAGNHALYQRLETALQLFFTETDAEKQQKQERKRQRTSLLGAPVRRSVGGGDEAAGTLEQRDCQLVYLLEHKYTNPGLSFAYLKNKDHLVAQSLAKFCEDSLGAFSLYLCKVKYTYEYDPDNHEPEYVEKSVQLKTPWIKYGEQTAVPCQQMTASIGAEIAPAGFFEEVPFDGHQNHGYTGNAGARAEKWYTSAALVVQPLKIELAQTARAGMDYAVNKWIQMVEAESPHAESFATMLFAEQRLWSSTDMCLLPCLKAVRRLNKVDLFGDVLHSLSEISFLDVLATTVDHFGWSQCIDLIVEVAAASRLRSRVNLICSVLHGCEDAAKINELLSKVDAKPTLSVPLAMPAHYSLYMKPPANLSSEEYARLFALAFRVSPETLREYVTISETNVLIKLVAPALVTFVNSLDGDTKPAPLIEIVREFASALQARMPQASSWDMSHIRLHGGRTCCQYCTELQMFLSSRTQQTLRRTMNKQMRHHVHKVIETYCGSKMSHETDRPSTLVMTKLLPAVDMHDVARDAMRALRAWAGDNEDGAVEAPPSTKSAPAYGGNEIIEIDSDY